MNRTIVAISTPSGNGAIAVIRLSGSETFRILGSCFSNKRLGATANTVLYGHILDEDEIIDEVIVAVFKAPHSYTKEDIVEISCHGSVYIQNRIISLLLLKGASLAQPGEFTQRAFLNGRFNLLQAEAVADLIASESAAQHQLALHQMKGGITHRLDKMREEMIHLTALLELELDFGEEDVEFANRDQLQKTTLLIKEEVQQLAGSFQSGDAIKKGIPIAIAGPPNVGKSTLLNYLLQDEKAIVSDIPGTTRDVIEDTLIIDGVLFRLIDTAGIRDTDDVVESIGIERSKKAIEKATLTLLLYDSDMQHKFVMAIKDYILDKGKKIIPVRTKSDQHPEAPKPLIAEEISISAKTGSGIKELKEAITTTCGLELGKYDATVSNIRHYEALIHADIALENVLRGLSGHLSSELVAEELRSALYYIGSITGAVVPDDILGAIFSRFCIGK